MSISIFDLFSIGIGPSSSHTVGPLRAARKFLKELISEDLLKLTHSVKIDLYGSLALTGKGHGTDTALILGLIGEKPETVDPNKIDQILSKIKAEDKLFLFQEKEVSFSIDKSICFHLEKFLAFHPNGMKFTANSKDGKELFTKTYYSVGGGFIVDHEHVNKEASVVSSHPSVPYPFATAEELLRICSLEQLTIQEVIRENEKTFQSEEKVKKALLNIWHVMEECIERGCEQEGVLPGGLKVQRRAKAIKNQLLEAKKNGRIQPTDVMEWVSLWALAVNEENAAAGRVVTAPTNGSAGIIPAVIKYYLEFTPSPSKEGVETFLLVAGAIGILYKTQASISAAEMGCMGEVGVACSMAAAGLTAAMGGTNAQIENAAEIGMEHNLGLTCDPIMGLVQVPCIERNAVGALHAIWAMLLAIRGDGTHRVSLDQVIQTMRQTGHDMHHIYKETSLGGLAVNVPEC